MPRTKSKLGLVPTQKALISLAVIGILAAASFGAWAWYRASKRCGDGVERRGADRECTGVTDGVFPYSTDQGFSNVEKKILKENESLKGKQFVSIALLRAMTGLDSEDQQAFLHELEGAYVAQYRANHEHEAEGKLKPPIRLLVANDGHDGQQWRPVVQQLKGLLDPPDNLLAVVALGPSLDTTKQALESLSASHVPTVGATITADDLTGFPGLVRVAPTNTDEAHAAVEFGKAQKGLVIRDTNPENHYVDTLGTVFSNLLSTSSRQPEPFNSKSMPGNTFRAIRDEMCLAAPDVIYFAGRGSDLKNFVEELGKRDCHDLPFTIVTGDDASQMSTTNAALKAALATHIRVCYTALAHPEASSNAPPTTGGWARDYAAFGDAFSVAFPGVELVDGQAIMAHDAVLTAITGIQAITTDQNPNPTRAQLIEWWPRLHGFAAVKGASGTISLDNHGNPDNKAIPILEIKPDGTVAFVQLAWPKGVPPEPSQSPR
jgi:ABC-type branched-subunit amino acid transport system substrate-binding protein